MQNEPMKIIQRSEEEFEIRSFGRSTVIVGFENLMDEVMYFFIGKSPLYPGTSRYGKVVIETNDAHSHG